MSSYAPLPSTESSVQSRPSLIHIIDPLDAFYYAIHHCFSSGCQAGSTFSKADKFSRGLVDDFAWNQNCLLLTLIQLRLKLTLLGKNTIMLQLAAE